MLVRVLGPLELVANDGLVPLGGVRQRMVLAHLLLHGNQVVSTTRLMSALWGDRIPLSGKKVVQNAVSRLRRLLAAHDEVREVLTLHTRPSGYVLAVDPEQVDLHRFRALAERGREALASGAPEAAAASLAQALALWRGRALSDLVDGGAAWPELAMLEGERLDAQEQCFEAELARGRHQAVLSDLVTAVDRAPARERLVGQLMLAYHRCGRQVDALRVYRSARERMAEEFGLDPGRALRDLARTISGDGGAPVPETAAAPAPPGDEAPAEIRNVTTLLVRLSLCGPHVADPERLHHAIDEVDPLVTAAVERFGGLAGPRTGTLWTVSFGVERARDDDTVRAVQAGFHVRQAFADHTPPLDGAALRMVVCDGRALVLSTPSGPSITGPAAESGLSLLPFVEPGELWVNGLTRDRARAEISFRRAPVSLEAWSAAGVAGPRPESEWPLVGRARELAELDAEVDRCLLDRRPRLVTVVGEPGVGKSRLLEEVCRRLGLRSGPRAPTVLRVPPRIGDTPMPVLRQNVYACAGILPDDPPETAAAKLADVVRSGARSADEADWILTSLSSTIGVASHHPATGSAEHGRVWRRFLLNLAARGPVVLVVDNLTHTEDMVGRVVRDLVASDERVALLVLASAGPAQLEDSSRWRAFAADGAVVGLPPLRPADVHRLLARVLPSAGEELRTALTGLCRGNARFAVEYAAEADRPGARADHGGLAVPEPVARALAIALDGLRPDLKAVLVEAALVGDSVWPSAVAAASGLTEAEALPLLRDLAAAGVLTAVEPSVLPGQVRYAFEHPLLRHVAWSSLPASRRSAAVVRVVDWLTRLDAPDADALRRHFGEAVAARTPPVVVVEQRRVVPASPSGTHHDLVRDYLALVTPSSWHPPEVDRLVRLHRADAAQVDAARGKYPTSEKNSAYLRSNASPRGGHTTP